MGCIASSDQDHDENRKRTKHVEAQLRQMNQAWNEEIKILLLGIGESGKSTVAKQMKVLYLDGFNDNERREFIPTIHSNVLSSMKILLSTCAKLELSLDDPDILQLAAKYSSIDHNKTVLSVEHAKELSTLWQNKTVQKVYDLRWTYFLPGCVAYFFSALERISASEYTPNVEDILRCRAKTTSVIETEFECESTPFRMVDVGGQRSERRKWIHCFQDVSALIYVVAIDEFDQRLAEAVDVMRITESTELFHELVNSVWFRSVAVILFLNKIDLFREKIKHKCVSEVFPNDYKGKPNSYEDGLEFFEKRFQSLNCIQNRIIYSHPTCATDSNNIQVVFKATKEFLVKQTISTIGFSLKLFKLSLFPLFSVLCCISLIVDHMQGV